MSASASGELFDVVVAKAVELEVRVKELELERAGAGEVIAELRRSAGEEYSKGHDELEFAIAKVIGREANSVELEIQQVVANIKRQRDEAQARLTIVMAQDEPYSVLSVLRVLADAVDHLLADHGCDTNGHEGIAAARGQARVLIDRIVEVSGASPQTSDWCPTCKQGWDCAKRDQESRVELNKLKRAHDEMTFIEVCEERDQFKTKLEQRQAELDKLERASMNKREAQDILTRCDQGVQNCHRCPALGCGDNRTGEA